MERPSCSTIQELLRQLKSQQEVFSLELQAVQIGESKNLTRATQLKQNLESQIAEIKEMLALDFAQAQEILGVEKCYGQEAIKDVFGISIEEVPLIPYTKEELEIAKQEGMCLVLRVNKDSEGNKLSSKRMVELCQDKYSENKNQEKRILLSKNSDWYRKPGKEEEFYIKETPELGWKLVSGKISEKSTSENYISQTRILRDKLKELGWLTAEEEANCTDAKLESWQKLLDDDYNKNWKTVADEISQATINQNHRPSFADQFYDMVIMDSNNSRPLKENYCWTKTQAASGPVVLLGNFGSEGAGVGRWTPDVGHSWLGVCFSR